MNTSTLPATMWRAGITLPLLAPLAGFAIVALVVGDESVELALALVILAALVWKTATAPLAIGVLLPMFVGLALESPEQHLAGGKWQSPLYTLGAVMLSHLNTATGVKALFFSGIDLMLFCLFGVMLLRRRPVSTPAHGQTRPGRTPLWIFAWLSLLGTLVCWLYGVSVDGNVGASLWQANKLYYLPLAVILFERALGESRDYRPFGRVLVLAACLKALVAVWISVLVLHGPVPFYATTHADSILFACATSVIVALYVEERRRTRRALYLFALPLVLVGMVANNRRLAWVAVASAIATYYLITPWTVRKRTLTRAALLSVPLVAVYLAIGWTSPSAVFAPARLVASVVSSEIDGSTRWRDLENFNLIYTIAQNPLLGSGFGHEYVERVRLPDISMAFPMFRYQPHNGMLGLWAFGGVAGFTAHWLLLVAGIFFAARAYRYAARPMDRAAALACVAAIVTYMISAYGDTTLGSWPGVFTVGPAIALSSHLAASTGGWPATSPSTVSAPAPRLVPGPSGASS